ncbi:hypothetical protein FRC02_005096 [Tulasnella sp. 418]|nr:hypothetical protein FRC02_005096 [Tulasnella sp. 418]
MTCLPKLPPMSETPRPVPGPIQLAFNMLRMNVNHCRSRIKNEEDDPIRIKTLRDWLLLDATQVIHALHHSGLFSKDWVNQCAAVVVQLRVLMLHMIDSAQEMESNMVEYTNPVATYSSGQQGCPTKVIDPQWLSEALSPNRRISVTEIASTTNVSCMTVYQNMKKHGIACQWTALDDEQVDNVVHQYQIRRPQAGHGYVMGHFRAFGIQIQQSRITASI